MKKNATATNTKKFNALNISNHNKPSHHTNGVKKANHKYLIVNPKTVNVCASKPNKKRLFKYTVENPTIGEKTTNHSVRPEPVQKWTFCNLYTP